MSANVGITIGSARFTDLIYADDTTLFCLLQMMHQLHLSSFSEAAGPFGRKSHELKLNYRIWALTQCQRAYLLMAALLNQLSFVCMTWQLTVI